MIRMIRHNFGYKLMALAVAVVLWSYVNAERNPQAEKTFKVPVKMLNVAEGYTAEPETPDVAITIQGPRSVVDRVELEDVSASADVSNISARGEGKTVALNVLPRVNRSEGELAITVNPGQIQVHLEQLRDQRLPVDVRFPSVPPLGFAYGNPDISPASVSVSGPASAVAQVKRVVLTLPSKVSGKQIDDNFAVIPVDSQGLPVPGVALDSSEVHLKLQLVEVPASKRVIVSAEIRGAPAYPAHITSVKVDPSEITLQGRPASLTDVTSIQTDPISVEGAASSVIRDVNLKLPVGVAVDGPSRVRVTISIASD